MLLKMKFNLHIVSVSLMFAMKYILFYNLWFIFLFNTDYLITLQVFVKCCLCDNEMIDIICNIFNKKNNLFNVFVQMKQFVNIFKKMTFKLCYINETQILTSIYLTLQQCLCFWAQQSQHWLTVHLQLLFRLITSWTQYLQTLCLRSKLI